MQWLLVHSGFDWLVVLSGQDYPIRPIAEIENSLAVTDVEAFIETRPCKCPAPRTSIDEFAGRYYYRWRRLPFSFAPLLMRAFTRLNPFVRVRKLPSGSWVGVPARRSPFGRYLTCHYGSDWFTLSRSAVHAVDRFVRTRPDVLHYYRRTLIPTESFVQTILANDTSLRLCGDYRRYLAFDPRNPARTRILGIEDLDSMLVSGGDFARKFDHTVDHEVLDEIDRRVHSA
jgi:hypothetical protein